MTSPVDGRAPSPRVRRFRVVAVVEACSYLVLLGASLLKRVFDGPDLVPYVGLVHGLIFLVYFALAVGVRRPLGWDTHQTLTVVVAAVVPFGGIYVERNLTGRP